MNMENKPTNVLLSDFHKRVALKKAKSHLDTLSGVEKTSLSAALRHLIETHNDPIPSPKTKKKAQ